MLNHRSLLSSAAYAQIHGAAVSIETDKGEYIQGETVMITLSVKNEMPHPLTVLDLPKAKPILLKDALISFELETPDGKIRPLAGDGGGIRSFIPPEEAPEKILNAGEEERVKIEIAPAWFEQTGSYKLSAQYLGGIQITSNQVTFSVAAIPGTQVTGGHANQVTIPPPEMFPSAKAYFDHCAQMEGGERTSPAEVTIPFSGLKKIVVQYIEQDGMIVLRYYDEKGELVREKQMTADQFTGQQP